MAYIPIDEDVFERAMNDQLTWSDYEAAVKNVADNMPKSKVLLPKNADGE